MKRDGALFGSEESAIFARPIGFGGRTAEVYGLASTTQGEPVPSHL